ncbi:MAG: hypothetical protein U1E05_22180, partial [Patescibacteria group bacterium]|nr:hypothetical protein [Patescibacteria group bacterium]
MDHLEKQMNWKKTVLLGLLALVVVVSLVFGGLVLSVWFMIPRETHSLRKYPALRAQWDQELVDHFPDAIPESATLKRFSHFPGFLQGGAYIQLRLGMPSGQIEELYDRFLRHR